MSKGRGSMVSLEWIGGGEMCISVPPHMSGGMQRRIDIEERIVVRETGN
jgi:ABC-type ATPase involved in cell division